MLEEVQIWLVSTRALKIILAMVLLVNTKGTSLWLPLVVVQFTENCVLSTQMSKWNSQQASSRGWRGT